MPDILHWTQWLGRPACPFMAQGRGEGCGDHNRTEGDAKEPPPGHIRLSTPPTLHGSADFSALTRSLSASKSAGQGWKGTGTGVGDSRDLCPVSYLPGGHTQVARLLCWCHLNPKASQLVEPLTGPKRWRQDSLGLVPPHHHETLYLAHVTKHFTASHHFPRKHPGHRIKTRRLL